MTTKKKKTNKQPANRHLEQLRAALHALLHGQVMVHVRRGTRHGVRSDGWIGTLVGTRTDSNGKTQRFEYHTLGEWIPGESDERLEMATSRYDTVEEARQNLHDDLVAFLRSKLPAREDGSGAEEG